MARSEAFVAEDSNSLWHRHPIFQRFWCHYTHSCHWYKQHVISQQLLQQENCHDCFSTQLYQDKSDSQSCQQRKTFEKKISSNRRRKNKRKRKQQKISEHNSEIEVTEEFFRFLEETEKHRQEQQSLKQKAQKDENALDQSHGPPKCREITSQRSSEMKTLYGTAAAKIHGMETAMQLTFNRYNDLKQPKLWPNIPLNM